MLNNCPSRFSWLFIAVTTLVVPMLSTSAFGQNASGAKPNVLLIVSDDQRPDTIAALGNDVIQTPNLDRLVEQGSVFTRAACANPICTPSRGEILSGCSGFRTGVLDFGGKPRDGFVAFAETMKRGGYETAYVGKWHNKGRPSAYGYDNTAGLYGGGGWKWNDPNRTDAHGRPITGYTGWVFQSEDGTEKFPDRGVGLTGDISQKFADASIELIQQPRKKPWFIHVNFTAPHDPLLMPPGFEDAYDPESMPLPKNFLNQHPFDHGNQNSRDESLLPLPRTEQDVREDLAVYYAVISHLDQQVGRILESLDQTGQRENTIIIFTSDHGLAMGSHGLRGKQNMYEHTINVPMLMSGPGIPEQKRFNAQMYLRDIYPTVCDLVGLTTPQVPGYQQDHRTLDGRSVGPVLRGKQNRIYEHTFGYFRNLQRMVRSDDWKLIHYPKVERWQLFHLAEDPDELQNLADDPKHAEKKRELQAKLLQWQTAIHDPVFSRKSSN